VTAFSTSYEVLIVDDDLSAAESFAQLVRAETGLPALTTSHPDQATEAVRAHPLKVVVLDQRMPLATGTELLPRLRQIDGRLRAILLTGEADSEDFAQAVGTFQVFLRKTDVLQLPGRVLEQYAAYLDSAPPSSNGPIFSLRRGLPGRRFRVDYHLVLITVVDAEFIPEDAWKAVLQVNSGEKKTHSETLTLAEEVSVAQEESMSMASTLGLKGSQLQPFEAALRSEISQRLGVSASKRTERTITHEEEYFIAPEPGDPIRARSYQHAPVFRRLNVAIAKQCTCCDGSAISTFRVLQKIPRVATRQMDFMSEGEPKVHRTGYLEAS
jgi:CheY-like chemotaxis protein